MKKLLVLMLVLGMVSMANAALELRIGGSSVGGTAEVLSGVTIQLYSDDTSTWQGYVFLAEGGDGSLGDGAIAETTPGQPGYPGDQGGITGPITYTGFGVGYQMQADYLSTSTPVVAGIQFTMSLTGDEDDTGTINFWANDNYTTPVDTLDYTIIPEPVTIALLGLGGLFLRRRK